MPYTIGIIGEVKTLGYLGGEKWDECVEPPAAVRFETLTGAQSWADYLKDGVPEDRELVVCTDQGWSIMEPIDADSIFIPTRADTQALADSIARLDASIFAAREGVAA